MRRIWLGVAIVAILALVVIFAGYFFVGPMLFKPVATPPTEPSVTVTPVAPTPAVGTPAPATPAAQPPAVEVPAAYKGKTNPYWGDSAAISEGEGLYSNCVSCHGETGEGIGLPGQPDFTAIGYWEGRSDDEMLFVTAEGRGAMPSWKAQLSEDQIWKLLAYSRTLAREVAAPPEEAVPEEELEPEAVPIVRWEERDERGLIVGSAAYFGGDPTLGRTVYTANCEFCHGERGDGNGPAASSLEPKPSDFTNEAWMRRERDVHFFYSTWNGVEQSDMPAFKDRLSEEDVWDAIAYLREFTGIEGKSAKVILVDGALQYIGETGPDDINCLACHDYTQHKNFHVAGVIMKIDSLKNMRRRICVDCHGPLGPPWSADEQLTDPRDIEYDPNVGLNGVFNMPTKVPHNIHLERINEGSLDCQFCHLRKDELVVPAANVELGQVLNCENCGHHPEGGNFWTVHIEMNGLPCTICHTGDMLGIHSAATQLLGQVPAGFRYPSGVVEVPETTTVENTTLG